MDTLKVNGINSKGYGSISKIVVQDRRLPASAKGLYAYFCSFAGGGTDAFPSRKKICYDMNIKQDTFDRILNYLIGYGYIIKHSIKHDEKGRFARNIYEIANKPVEKPEIIKQLLNKTKNTNKRNIYPCPNYPYTDNPLTEKPCTDNRDTNNNNNKNNRNNINKITTTNKKEKNTPEKIIDVGVDQNINILANIFSKLTGRTPEARDYNVIIELLDCPLSVPISQKSRIEIITKVICRIYSEYKAKNPDKNVNSFKYFSRPILDEFKKYENIKGGENSGRNEECPTTNKVIVTKHGRSYDLSAIQTNR